MQPAVAMEAGAFPSHLSARCLLLQPGSADPSNFLLCSGGPMRPAPGRSMGTRTIRAIDCPSATSALTDAADLPAVQVSWQIVVGAVAGVTPFIIAGIEFSKRIMAQKKCEVCGGSGLVVKNDYYDRCPGCGGFLPWHSWKRFFTG